VLIYEEYSDSSSVLCPPELLDDAFSRAGPGYYEEAVIDPSRMFSQGSQAVIKKNGTRLLDPDYRVGNPFL